MRALARCALVVALSVIWHGPAGAGSVPGGETHFSTEQIARLAKKVEKAMATRGARVALLARVGRPREELPDGIEFTHVAFAVYSRITTADGRVIPGYATFNLYQDNDKPDSSFLRQDYVLDYYSNAYELKAGIIIPDMRLQRRLLDTIDSDTYVKLHNPHYSAIANPFSTRYQNCTEFVLDVINAAIYRTDSRKQIKANLLAYFEPEPVRVSSLKLTLGSMFTPDVFISDHQGPVRTATFGSIAKYMLRHHLAMEVFTLSE